MKILVVEDEYNLADAIKTRLEKEKYIVDIAKDGANVTLKNITIETSATGANVWRQCYNWKYSKW